MERAKNSKGQTDWNELKWYICMLLFTFFWAHVGKMTTKTSSTKKVFLKKKQFSSYWPFVFIARTLLIVSREVEKHHKLEPSHQYCAETSQHVGTCWQIEHQNFTVRPKIQVLKYTCCLGRVISVDRPRQLWGKVHLTGCSPAPGAFCISAWLAGWDPERSTRPCRAPPPPSAQMSPSPSWQHHPLHPKLSSCEMPEENNWIAGGLPKTEGWHPGGAWKRG